MSPTAYTSGLLVRSLPSTYAQGVNRSHQTPSGHPPQPRPLADQHYPPNTAILGPNPNQQSRDPMRTRSHSVPVPTTCLDTLENLDAPGT
jgi:hypothetical protein